MATDIATIRARLVDERATVVAQIAAIDMAAEQARMTTAESDFTIAQQKYQKFADRWAFVVGIQNTLAEIDRKIALVTP